MPSSDELRGREMDVPNGLVAAMLKWDANTHRAPWVHSGGRMQQPSNNHAQGHGSMADNVTACQLPATHTDHTCTSVHAF